ncbi:hypothetical protein MMC29_000044 [Sticta canariensis]|nr:hypothetical protein [Sticta canariensis]
MASGSIAHVPVDVATATSTTYCDTTCDVCIANPNHDNSRPAIVQQLQQQQQEENIITSSATLKICLLCSRNYCPRHESEQEGVCSSDHVSLWKKKKSMLDEKEQQHQGEGESSRPVGRKVRVFRSSEQRPQRT